MPDEILNKKIVASSIKYTVERMKKERNSTVEFLRILSMLLIVWFHLCGRGLGLFSEEIPNGGDNSLPLIVMQALGKTGVPIFMFISGYYGVRFKWNRLKDILIQAVLYTIVFYSIACLFLPIFQFRVFVLQVFGVSGIWFVNCYIVLYILSDGINAVLDKLNFKAFSIVVLILLYIAVGKWIGKEGGCNLFTMIEYYIIARYVRKYVGSYKSIVKWMMIPSVVLFVLPICYGYCCGYYSAIYPYVFSYYNPLLILVAMSMVVSADDFKTHNKTINYVAGSVLAVYMLHENCYTPEIVAPFLHFDNFSVLNATFVILIVFVIAVLIDKFREKICSSLMK